MKRKILINELRECKGGDLIITAIIILLTVEAFRLGHFDETEGAGFQGIVNWALYGGAICLVCGLFGHTREEVFQSILKARHEPMSFMLTTSFLAAFLFALGAVLGATLWFVLRYGYVCCGYMY